jgi:lantibiotic modifying enzyme
MLAGFAHGASGTAHALVRLWRTTRESEFLEGARRAVEFENTLYDEAKKNWPLVLRDPDGVERARRNMVAWCHGAPGIALARASFRDVLSEAEDRDALTAALETTRMMPASGPDHLCCGTLGRVEVLYTVGRKLGRSRLQSFSESRAAMVVRVATARGAYLLDNQEGPPRAGLFRGLAGIGYQMLRLARPEDVPSVLAFDSTGG